MKIVDKRIALIVVDLGRYYALSKHNNDLLAGSYEAASLMPQNKNMAQCLDDKFVGRDVGMTNLDVLTRFAEGQLKGTIVADRALGTIYKES